MSFQPVLTGVAHTPNGPGQMQFACFGLGDHAVEVATRAAAEVGWRFCRDDCDGDGGLLPPMARHASAPDEFGIPSSSRSQSAASTDLGPARRLIVEVRLQPRRKLYQLHRRNLEEGTEVSSNFARPVLCARRSGSCRRRLPKPLNGWFSPEDTGNRTTFPEEDNYSIFQIRKLVCQL